MKRYVSKFSEGLQKGSPIYNIFQLLDREGSASKGDIMIAGYGEHEVMKWKKNVGRGNPFTFGDGMLGLKEKGWLEQDRSAHGFWRLTKMGQRYWVDNN